MVLCDKEGKVIKVYPYGSEEQLRCKMVLEILFEADKRSLEKLLEGRRQKEPKVMISKKRNNFRREGKFWVYIVECQDRTFYTGYTPDLVKRIELHNKGKGAKYTRDRRPVKLVWCREYKYFKKAFLEEKRIKRLTREEKEDLVNGNKR